MKIYTHRYVSDGCSNRIEVVERDLPANRIVWVSEDGGMTWKRTSVGDVGFICFVIGDTSRMVLAPDGPEFL